MPYKNNRPGRFPGVSFILFVSAVLVVSGPFFSENTGPALQGAPSRPILEEKARRIAAKIWVEYLQGGQRKRSSRMRRVRRLLAALMVLRGRHPGFEPHECMAQDGINPLYLSAPYFPRFQRDQRRYATVIIGDSTMDMNAALPGWLDPGKTQSVAVPGNSLCHYISSFRKSIHTRSPRTILVGSLGGNDMREGASAKKLVRLTRLLARELKRTFPGARLVGVSVHPVRLPSMNRISALVNPAIRRAWLEETGGCWLETRPLFRIAPHRPAGREHMRPGDFIHYNRTIAFRLKKALREKCNLTL